jgi:large subunit ribosomal protein L21
MSARMASLTLRGGALQVYAVFETGGKQYRVAENDVIFVEKLAAAEGDEVVFENVLMLGKKIGAPYVKGAKVVGVVEKQGKNKKIIVFKYKPKKNYRKKQGHRQPYTKIKITKIEG